MFILIIFVWLFILTGITVYKTIEVERLKFERDRDK